MELAKVPMGSENALIFHGEDGTLFQRKHWRMGGSDFDDDEGDDEFRQS